MMLNLVLPRFLLRRRTYSSLILTGLFFSCIGDACLWPGLMAGVVYEKLFLSGVFAFAVAHVCYISAFKVGPFAPKLMMLLGLILSTSEFFSLKTKSHE